MAGDIFSQTAEVRSKRRRRSKSEQRARLATAAAAEFRFPSAQQPLRAKKSPQRARTRGRPV